MPIMQDILRQPLWSRRVAMFVVEHRLYNVNTTTHNVTDNDAVRIDSQLLGINTFVNVDTQLFELRAHRWVDVAIAACHFVACGTRERSDATHECAANTKNMYVHFVLDSRIKQGLDRSEYLQLCDENGQSEQDSYDPRTLYCTSNDMSFDQDRPQ